MSSGSGFYQLWVRVQVLVRILNPLRVRILFCSASGFYQFLSPWPSPEFIKQVRLRVCVRVRILSISSLGPCPDFIKHVRVRVRVRILPTLTLDKYRSKTHSLLGIPVVFKMLAVYRIICNMHCTDVLRIGCLRFVGQAVTWLWRKVCDLWLWHSLEICSLFSCPVKAGKKGEVWTLWYKRRGCDYIPRIHFR